MSAGAGDRRFDAARSQPLRGDVIRGGAIDGNYRAQARAISFHQRANPAQIPFPFFAHVAGKNNRHAGADVAFFERARNRDERGKSRAVIGNSRALRDASLCA